MSARKPFTIRERKQISYGGFGHRPVNNWGDGDLPAPWCIGDVVRLREQPSYDRDFLRRLSQSIDGRTLWLDRGRSEAGGRRLEHHSGFFVVASGYSIDEGDAWYFRVSGGDSCSDRMHVAHPTRASRHWRGHAVNYMRLFDLIETADAAGLASRNAMLRSGWRPSGASR